MTQKSNKKSLGCRKKAKIYFVTLQWMSEGLLWRSLKPNISYQWIEAALQLLSIAKHHPLLNLPVGRQALHYVNFLTCLTADTRFFSKAGIDKGEEDWLCQSSSLAPQNAFCL